MGLGTQGDDDASRVEQYDFDRLEQSVEFLINEHERLSGEREELLAELVDREQRISKLESRLQEEQNKRATAAEGVNKILARLEQLRTTVTERSGAAS